MTQVLNTGQDPALEVWVAVTAGAQGEGGPGCVPNTRNEKLNWNEGFAWWRGGKKAGTMGWGNLNIR